MTITGKEIEQVIGNIDQQIEHYAIFVREMKAEPEVMQYARQRLEYLKGIKKLRKLSKTA